MTHRGFATSTATAARVGEDRARGAAGPPGPGAGATEPWA